MARRKDKPKLFRKHVHLEERQIEALERLSDNTGAPFAELIRQAIDKMLKTRK